MIIKIIKKLVIMISMYIVDLLILTSLFILQIYSIIHYDSGDSDELKLTDGSNNDYSMEKRKRERERERVWLFYLSSL
jgi:hypothetical protein